MRALRRGFRARPGGRRGEAEKRTVHAAGRDLGKDQEPHLQSAEGRAELLDRTVARNSQEILSKDVMPLGGLSKRANQPEGYGIRPDTHRAILG